MRTLWQIGVSFGAALALAAPAVAAGEPTPRFRSQVVYGEDACPQSSDEEIVVCARQPESERYRVPKRLREEKRNREAANEAWGSRVQTLEMASRANLPNSCSPVGSGGQTGCYQQFLRQYREERRMLEEEAALVP